MKTAIITGVTGQDGSYLAELLLNKGYFVHGIRPHSSDDSRLKHIISSQFALHSDDLSNSDRIRQLLVETIPDEVYNLAAHSHVGQSFDKPLTTIDPTALGALRILEAIRGTNHKIRFFQASTGEIFGPSYDPANEQTPYDPRSPYATAKLFAHCTTINYRRNYELFACNGIMFSHESPRRSERFVVRKIVKSAVDIHNGQQTELRLGKLDIARDWGYAPEFVEAAWRTLQQDNPDDYVLATGQTHTLRELLETVFGNLGLDWNQYVVFDQAYCRPADLNSLCGNAAKANRVLKWNSRVGFDQLVSLLLEAELRAGQTAVYA